MSCRGRDKGERLPDGRRCTQSHHSALVQHFERDSASGEGGDDQVVIGQGCAACQRDNAAPGISWRASTASRLCNCVCTCHATSMVLEDYARCVDFASFGCRVSKHPFIDVVVPTRNQMHQNAHGSTWQNGIDTTSPGCLRHVISRTSTCGHPHRREYFEEENLEREPRAPRLPRAGAWARVSRHATRGIRL